MRRCRVFRVWGGGRLKFGGGGLEGLDLLYLVVFFFFFFCGGIVCCMVGVFFLLFGGCYG